MAETGRVVGTDTTGVAVNVDSSSFERQIVNIGDAVTNVAKVGTTGGLSVQAASSEQASLSVSTLNGFLVPSTDCTGYVYLSLQITAMAGGGAITWQGSNDNVNWFSAPLKRISQSLATDFLSTTVPDIYAGPIMYRYFRAQQTSWTSGSTTGALEMFTISPQTFSISGQVAINGSQATNTLQINGNTVNTGTGAAGTGTQRVAVSSDSQVLVQGYQPAPTTVGPVTTAAAQASQSCTNYNIVTVTLRTFTGTGPSITWRLEASDDNTNWVILQGINNATGVVGSTWTQASALTAGTAGPSLDYTIGAYTNVRINVTAESGTSPSATFGLSFQTMSYESSPGAITQGTTAAAATLAGNAVATAGTDSGGLVRVLRTDTSGLLLIGAGGATMGFVNPAPTTSATAALSTGLASSLTVLNIKASAGNVYGMSIQNGAAATTYIQFYNTAGTPTLGTSVIWWIAVPASSTLTIPPGAIAMANHATGIGIGASTTPTSTGTPATAPNVTVFYK